MLVDNRRIAEVLEIVPQQARERRKPVAGARRETGGGAAALPPGDVPLLSDPPNQEIFEVILDLHHRDHAVDLTTLGEELSRTGRFEAVGGASYLAALEESLVSTLYVHEYARIVVEKWRLRTLLNVAESIARDALSAADHPDEIIDRSEQKIFEIAQETQNKDFVAIGEVAVEVMADIEARFRQDPGATAGLMTGFEEFDKMTSGLRPANLVIVAARPSMGKSAFVMNIAAECAIRHGRAVGMFSLEMSSMELNQRLLSMMAKVPLWKIRASRLSRGDLEELHTHAMRLGTTPFYIDDSSNVSVMELRARARRLKARVPHLSLLVVDYLQLMSGSRSRNDSRQQEVAEISRSLKILARDLEIPIIALSQLSRASEQRGGKNIQDRLPKLSDLRESGAIEQDADMVVFIHRDFQSRIGQDPEAKSEPDLATIRIGKQRNGPTGDFNLLFLGEFTQFVNLHKDAKGGF